MLLVHKVAKSWAVQMRPQLHNRENLIQGKKKTEMHSRSQLNSLSSLLSLTRNNTFLILPYGSLVNSIALLLVSPPGWEINTAITGSEPLTATWYSLTRGKTECPVELILILCLCRSNIGTINSVPSSACLNLVSQNLLRIATYQSSSLTSDMTRGLKPPNQGLDQLVVY